MKRCFLLRFITLLLALTYSLNSSQAGAEQKLIVGVTLHPYYSWVANIAGDTVTLLPVIPAQIDPHSYQPRAQDLETLRKFDVIVVNTLGHDGYIDAMLKAAGQENIPKIKPNTGVPLIPSNHKNYKLKQEAEKNISYNSHTYVSILGAIQQINTIANELGAMQPDHARLYQDKARQYAKKLRNLLRSAIKKLQDRTDKLTIATVHDGYAYMFQELGITMDAVIQPRHGIEPSARQLADTIKRIQKAKVNILFTEVDYQKKYVETIFKETGCKMYPLSHVSNGPYSADKFLNDMQKNLNTITRALTANEPK